MAIQRKQIHDANAPATKHAKKKSKKTKKVKSTSLAVVQKCAINDDSSSQSFAKSKLVSALFNNDDNFKSAFEGNFELSNDQVKQLSTIVTTSQTELKQALLIIYKNEGYKKLGCADFKAYVKENLTISYDVALKQVWAAKVAYAINGMDAIGFYSDNSMLPMKDLSNDQIEEVVEHIEEVRGEEITIVGKYTRKIVEAAMRSLGLLQEVNSNNDLDLDVNDGVEEDSVEQDDDSLDFDGSDDETLDSDTKPKTSTKQSFRAKHPSTDKIKQSKSHRQFLEQFNLKAEKCKSSKAIFEAFIETDAGKNQAILAKAIEFLMKQQISVMTLEAKAILEAQDE